jgi:hypothetical protein
MMKMVSVSNDTDEMKGSYQSERWWGLFIRSFGDVIMQSQYCNLKNKGIL